MKTRTRTPYVRTKATLEKLSNSMRLAWQRRKAEGYPSAAKINIAVLASNAKQLPRYAPTSAQALEVLLEGAVLLDWNFDPERGRWVPSLPKTARVEDGR